MVSRNFRSFQEKLPSHGFTNENLLIEMRLGKKKFLEGPLDELPYTNAVMRGEPMKCLLVNFLFGLLEKASKKCDFC